MIAPEVLQRSPLFRDFTENGLKIFAAIAQERAVPAGAPVFIEGAVGDGLVLVKSGSVRITQRAAGGERELGVLGPGEHLGALSLLAQGVRLVSAAAATTCEVVEIGRREFAALQAQKPQACLKLALAIAADVAARMAEGREALRELTAR